MSSDDYHHVEVRDDADSEMRAAFDQAVASAAAAGKRRSEELIRALETEEADVLAHLSEPGQTVPSESDLRDSECVEQALLDGIQDGAFHLPMAFSAAITVGPGSHQIATPPYDSEWRWGNATTLISNAVGGFVHIAGNSRDRNPTNAASGVGFRLRSTVRGWVTVRPYFQYDWRYRVHAPGFPFANATCTGGVDLAAFEGSTVVSDVRRVPLFRKRVSAGEIRGDQESGVVWPSDYEIAFPMVPGTAYAINIGAWIECSHNRGAAPPPVRPSAWGQIQGNVRWVVIQRPNV